MDPITSGGNSEPHINDERIVFKFLTFRTCFTVVESFVFKRPATVLASSSCIVLSLHVLVLNTNWRKCKKRNKSNALRKQSFKNYVPWITHNSKLSVHARFCHEINEGLTTRVVHTCSCLGLCTGRDWLTQALLETLFVEIKRKSQRAIQQVEGNMEGFDPPT